MTGSLTALPTAQNWVAFRAPHNGSAYFAHLGTTSRTPHSEMNLPLATRAVEWNLKLRTKAAIGTLAPATVRQRKGAAHDQERSVRQEVAIPRYPHGDGERSENRHESYGAHTGRSAIQTGVQDGKEGPESHVQEELGKQSCASDLRVRCAASFVTPSNTPPPSAPR